MVQETLGVGQATSNIVPNLTVSKMFSANETAFLSAFKCKMIEGFQQEWYSKVSSSERFATYCTFKSSHVAETYLNDITIKKKFRDALVRLRFGINELRVNKRYESENIVNKDCAFCPGILEDETHFLFHCPLYSSIRHKHISYIYFFFLFMYYYFIFVYGSVAFTINHVSVSVSLSLSLY